MESNLPHVGAKINTTETNYKRQKKQTVTSFLLLLSLPATRFDLKS
jgi:hypothetical protein